MLLSVVTGERPPAPVTGPDPPGGEEPGGGEPGDPGDPGGGEPEPVEGAGALRFWHNAHKVGTPAEVPHGYTVEELSGAGETLWVEGIENAWLHRKLWIVLQVAAPLNAEGVEGSQDVVAVTVTPVVMEFEIWKPEAAEDQVETGLWFDGKVQYARAADPNMDRFRCHYQRAGLAGEANYLQMMYPFINVAPATLYRSGLYGERGHDLLELDANQEQWTYPFVDMPYSGQGDAPEGTWPYLSHSPSRQTVESPEGGQVIYYTDGDRPLLSYVLVESEYVDGELEPHTWPLLQMCGIFTLRMHVVWTFPTGNLLSLGNRIWQVSISETRVTAEADWISSGTVSVLPLERSRELESIDTRTTTYWKHPTRGVGLVQVLPR